MGSDNDHFGKEEAWEPQFWGTSNWNAYLRLVHQQIELTADKYGRICIQQKAPLEALLKNSDWFSPHVEVIVQHSSEEDENWEDEDGFDEWISNPLQQYPLFIVFSGIYRWLCRIWETILDTHSRLFKPQQIWKFSQKLHDAHGQFIFALGALESNNIELAQCHFKNILVVINDAFHLLNRQFAHKRPAEIHKAYRALFDLRDIALQLQKEDFFGE